MTTKTIVQINKVIHCQLQLEDGTDFSIPMRSDGYIYATKRCRVGGKLVVDWLRLDEVKQLITKVQTKQCDMAYFQVPTRHMGSPYPDRRTNEYRFRFQTTIFFLWC